MMTQDPYKIEGQSPVGPSTSSYAQLLKDFSSVSAGLAQHAMDQHLSNNPALPMLKRGVALPAYAVSFTQSLQQHSHQSHPGVRAGIDLGVEIALGRAMSAVLGPAALPVEIGMAVGRATRPLVQSNYALADQSDKRNMDFLNKLPEHERVLWECDFDSGHDRRAAMAPFHLMGQAAQAYDRFGAGISTGIQDQLLPQPLYASPVAPIREDKNHPNTAINLTPVLPSSSGIISNRETLPIVPPKPKPPVEHESAFNIVAGSSIGIFVTANIANPAGWAAAAAAGVVIGIKKIVNHSQEKKFKERQKKYGQVEDGLEECLAQLQDVQAQMGKLNFETLLSDNSVLTSFTSQLYSTQATLKHQNVRLERLKRHSRGDEKKAYRTAIGYTDELGAVLGSSIATAEFMKSTVAKNVDELGNLFATSLTPEQKGFVNDIYLHKTTTEINTQISANNLTAAIQRCDNSLVHLPEQVDLLEWRKKIVFQQALSLAAEGASADALKLVQTPNYQMSVENIKFFEGYHSHLQGDDKAAISYLEAAKELNPQDPLTLSVLAEARAHLEWTNMALFAEGMEFANNLLSTGAQLASRLWVKKPAAPVPFSSRSPTFLPMTTFANGRANLDVNAILSGGASTSGVDASLRSNLSGPF